MLSYAITELEPPAGSPSGTFTGACAVATGGSAVGYYIAPIPNAGAEEPASSGAAVQWVGSDPVLLEEPRPDSAVAAGINDNGLVVGYDGYSEPSFPQVWHTFGPEVDVSSALYAAGGGSWGEAAAVNAQGLVTGYVTHNPFLSGVPTDLRPFIFDAVGGGVTLLDPLPGDEAAVGRGINDNGHVVGSSGNHMVLYRPAPENLGPGDAAAINKADQVAGSKVFGSGPRRACRIDASAASPVAEDLGHSPVPGYDGSRAYGINDDGVVVGESFSPSLPSRAFVYFPDGPDAGFHDLQPLLVNGDGWELDVAFDISNYGTIVGYGRHYGDMRGFQLEPTSPPSGGLDKKFVRIPDELLAFIFLFGGVEHGAGGSGVLPHGKPVPIPPHGLRDLWASLTPARRDLALGLAIQRLQSLISDPTQADRVGRVSEGLIEAASAQLRQIAADRRAGPIV